MTQPKSAGMLILNGHARLRTDEEHKKRIRQREHNRPELFG